MDTIKHSTHHISGISTFWQLYWVSSLDSTYWTNETRATGLECQVTTRGRRLVLLKWVLSSLPKYYMSVPWIPPQVERHTWHFGEEGQWESLQRLALQGWKHMSDLAAKELNDFWRQKMNIVHQAFFFALRVEFWIVYFHNFLENLRSVDLHTHICKVHNFILMHSRLPNM